MTGCTEACAFGLGDACPGWQLPPICGLEAYRELARAEAARQRGEEPPPHDKAAVRAARRARKPRVPLGQPHCGECLEKQRTESDHSA